MRRTRTLHRQEQKKKPLHFFPLFFLLWFWACSFVGEGRGAFLCLFATCVVSHLSASQSFCSRSHSVPWCALAWPLFFPEILCTAQVDAPCALIFVSRGRHTAQEFLTLKREKGDKAHTGAPMVAFFYSLALCCPPGQKEGIE